MQVVSKISDFSSNASTSLLDSNFSSRTSKKFNSETRASIILRSTDVQLSLCSSNTNAQNRNHYVVFEQFLSLIASSQSKLEAQFDFKKKDFSQQSNEQSLVMKLQKKQQQHRDLQRYLKARRSSLTKKLQDSQHRNFDLEKQLNLKDSQRSSLTKKLNNNQQRIVDF